MHVITNCGGGEVQLFSNFFIAKSSGNQVKDFELAITQSLLMSVIGADFN